MNEEEEIRFTLDPAVMYRENSGTLKIIKNEGNTASTKHFNDSLQGLK